MQHQVSRISVLEQVLESMKAWLYAFDTNNLGQINPELFKEYLNDLYGLHQIGIGTEQWENIPVHDQPKIGQLYNYSLFGIRLRSLVSFLETQLDRERQVQAVAGSPLTDEQVDLLRNLVMANRNVAAAQRQEIVGLSADGETRFFHPGLPNRSLAPNMVDLKRLTQLGLVNAHDRGGHQGWVIDVLPAGEAAIDALRSSSRPATTSESRQPSLPDGFLYHVAISYAAPDIQYAGDLATLVEQEGYKVFFDKGNPAEVWGKDLHIYLQQVFAEQALFCVLFISDEYKNRVWTSKELQDALERQVQLRGNGEYILPVQLVKGVKLPGLPSSIAYLSKEDYSIEKIRDFLVEKIDARVNH